MGFLVGMWLLAAVVALVIAVRAYLPEVYERLTDPEVIVDLFLVVMAAVVVGLFVGWLFRLVTDAVALAIFIAN